MGKETVYIEADDEITAVIEKVLTAKEQIVALVLPKRSTVFQSVVNTRLLKKAADDAKKKIVFITSDSSLDGIAAVAGVHVASSLTSKPSIPKKPKAAAAEKATTIESSELDDPAEDVPKAASLSTTHLSTPKEEDPIEIDNTSEVAEELPAGTLTTASSTTAKKKKIFKIPDFGSFRLKMTLGILAVILLATGWVFGFVIMPRATVTINTDTSSTTVTFDFKASTSAEELSLEESVLPATAVEVTKEDKVTVPATGEKDVGERASGTITLVNCRAGASGITIPAGTGFSAEGKTFSTTEAVELGPAVIIGTCRSADFPAFGAVKEVAVVANAPGESYNIEAQTYSSPTAGVSAEGTEMTGGTSKKIKVVSNDDINKAKEQLSGTASADALKELQAKLSEQSLQALNETLEQTEPAIKNTPAVDNEAAEVTVTQTVTYRMLGVNTDELAKLLESKIQKELENSAEKNIRNNGLDKAVYRLATKTSFDEQVVNFQTVATIGPVFDEKKIASEVAGKKRGDIEKMLEGRDGVRSVGVEYSPGWITTTPKSAEKIIIVINEIEE